ncbi:P-type conjugative transfer protein TrbG [Caulobacter sp. 602-1]|nr:P-type conjugative transfer protein TrbG [Caulobacter sp. 602-1]
MSAVALIVAAGFGAKAWSAAPGRPPTPLQAEVAPRTYAYEDGRVYAVLASPGRITDVVLQPGERLVGSGLAAGDTARWIIGDTVSGTGSEERVHVLVKPSALGLATNLIINTSLRTYHLDLRAVARGGDPQVRWRYAAPPVVLVAAPPVPVAPPVAGADPDLTRLNLAYRIRGARVAWRPSRVFDDGQRTYVEFAPAVRLVDLPPLFLTGPDGKSAELLNYRLVGRRLVVDRILDRAELRLGQGRWARRVRIVREAGR